MQIALVTPELRLVQSPCLADRALGLSRRHPAGLNVNLSCRMIPIELTLIRAGTKWFRLCPARYSDPLGFGFSPERFSDPLFS